MKIVMLFFSYTIFSEGYKKKVAQTETIWANLVNSSTPINCEVR